MACTVSEPCGGLLKEDLEYQRDALALGYHVGRLFRCVGAGHSFLIGQDHETWRPRPPVMNPDRRCRVCATPLPADSLVNRLYCSQRCCNRAFKERHRG